MNLPCASPLSLYAGSATIDWDQFGARLHAALKGDHSLKVTANHAVLTTSAAPDKVEAWIDVHAPELTVLCVGRCVKL